MGNMPIQGIQSSESNSSQKTPNIPSNFICSITGEMMKDPVINQYGQTYQKQAIERWFKDGNKKDPNTGVILKSTKLIPNTHLKNTIEEFSQAYLTKDPSKSNKKKNSEKARPVTVIIPIFLVSVKNNEKKLAIEPNEKATFKQLSSMKCPNNHRLKKYSDGGRKYQGLGSYVCNQCQKKQIEDDQEFYYCNQCDYDLCVDCKEKYN